MSAVLNDFRELIIYKNGKKERTKTANQDKGFVNEFKAFKDAVKNGDEAVSFESIYNTTKTTFKILESLKSKRVIKIDE